MSERFDYRQLSAGLERAGSPLQRLRFLAGAWRSLRELSRPERGELASEVGLDGAEQILERLARGGRLSPGWVQAVTGRMRGLSRDDLAELVEAARDPSRRGSVLRRGVDMLAGPEEQPTSGGIPESQETDRSDEPEGLPAGREPRSDSSAVRVVERSSEGVRKAGGVQQATEERASGAPLDGPPALRPEPARPSPSATAVVLSGPALPRSAAPPPPESSHPPASVPQSPAEETAPSEIIERLRCQRSLTGRFRVFRESLTDLAGLGAAELTPLVESFDPGWQRRRVVALLLRNGIPGGAEDAQELIDNLQSPLSRRWCSRVLEARDTLV